MRKKTTNLFT